MAVPPLAGLVEPGDRLFIGGPVSSQSAVVVADFEHPEAAEVVAFDSVGFLPEEADAESIGGLRRARVFAGYAGWAPASSKPSSTRARGSPNPPSRPTCSPTTPARSGPTCSAGRVPSTG